MNETTFFLGCYLEILNINKNFISKELQNTESKFEDFIDNFKNFCFELLEIDLEKISLANKEIIKKKLSDDLNEDPMYLIGYCVYFQKICDELILLAAKSNKQMILSEIIKTLKINVMLALNQIEQKNNRKMN